MKPLAGIVVLDFSTLLPGPLATLLLAEAGAEVIKIERPGKGDEMRTYEPRWGDESVNFAMLNRGKKSVALDLKDPAERRRLEPLLKRADILVEQFRPGVMQRLGLGYEAVASINPRLIYCSITGYGQSGPKRDRAGHDLNYIAETGLLAMSMGRGERPTVPPALIADIAGGSYPALINILLALRERDRTGRGMSLDIAMAENVFPFMYWGLGNGHAAGRWPGDGTDLVTGGSPRYNIYPTSDGGAVAAAPLEQKFWETFCVTISLAPELRDDSRQPDRTTAHVAAIIAAETTQVWRERLEPADCCCSVVTSLRDTVEDPHFIARELFRRRMRNSAGDTLPALPQPLAPAFRETADEDASAPALGAHTKEYLHASRPGA
jgi:crotonobetainyl-CoA:carnitine CoA-transferase CaiB-like acyl-CoA transferase